MWSRADALVPGAHQKPFPGAEVIMYDDLGHVALLGSRRVAAAVIEQCHDEHGIAWPDAFAPFRVIVCPINPGKSPAAKAAADKLYDELSAAGVEVLLDDRGERPGAMFADADLIGIPHRIVIGDKGLATNQFEYKHRRDKAPRMIAATAAAVREAIGA